MPTPEISVVIVSFNTRDLLQGCLRSLARVSDEAALEIIVVDNASTDGSAERVEADFPYVTLFKSPGNVGFAAAMNLGIAAASSEFLFCLNPDTLVPRTTLAKLVNLLRDHPQTAIAGASLTSMNGSPQTSVFPFPTLFREFWNFLPELKAICAWMLPRPASSEGTQSVDNTEIVDGYRGDCVAGTAFLARTEAIREVGGFDPEFFLYHEERDLCRRLTDKGWEIRSVPSAQVIHFDAQSTGYRVNRLPRSPVLEWRILGMDRLWQKHKSKRQHRLWSLQARSLLRLRIAGLSLWQPLSASRRAIRAARIEELRNLTVSLRKRASSKSD